MRRLPSVAAALAPSSPPAADRRRLRLSTLQAGELPSSAKVSFVETTLCETQPCGDAGASRVHKARIERSSGGFQCQPWNRERRWVTDITRGDGIAPAAGLWRLAGDSKAGRADHG